MGVPPMGSGYDFVGGKTANETPIRMNRYAGASRIMRIYATRVYIPNAF